MNHNESSAEQLGGSVAPPVSPITRLSSAHSAPISDRGTLTARLLTPPRYVYVASSWRNTHHGFVVAMLRSYNIGVYDFTGVDSAFTWADAGLEAGASGNDSVLVNEYLRALDHPRSVVGFESDFAAMQRADAFVLVLPCGRSAHLELGWAIGQGKKTAILFADGATIPELMYRMVDCLAPSIDSLLDWLGVSTREGTR